MNVLSKAGTAAALASVAIMAGAAPALAGDDVRVRDACDPATFDEALGRGICAPVDDGGGQVTFQALFDAVVEDGGHGAWRFTEEVEIEEGEDVVVRFDRGGEAHTFSKVAAFGPSCIPLVNAAIGFSPDEVTPECETFLTRIGDRIGGPGAPGPEQIGPAQRKLRVAGLSAGTHMFMCLVHPWMQTTVEVGEDPRRRF